MPSDRPVEETRALGRHMVVEKRPGAFWRAYTKRGELLGIIFWYGPWDSFVFRAGWATEFSADCLAALAAFLAQLRWEKKSGLKPIDGLSPKTATKESK
ncbi:hypothetical protein LCGC14_2280490 [marine sediment metagenome]|uniref:Uncharacterized protein n=1 Tax=marine sediment metagenome TaxID=412755 RepID=A0A0F9FPH2_9ZZZZ